MFKSSSHLKGISENFSKNFAAMSNTLTKFSSDHEERQEEDDEDDDDEEEKEEDTVCWLSSGGANRTRCASSNPKLCFAHTPATNRKVPSTLSSVGCSLRGK